MNFLADIHLHSRWSRATARDLSPETLHKWSMLKGLSVIGSGDFTHPAWLAELQEKLVPAEAGLYRLRPDLLDAVEEQVPPACRREVRFLLSVEVSSIYKKHGRTRKVHNVICLPTFDEVERLNGRLARIGNLAADGRPILGLDCRDLLEIVLETSAEALFVPAHIWTPHFAVLGSSSGFDSLEECYEDLLPHIFAVETGLSSDPPMNRRLSALDRFAVISNSDAHSAPKLGREATCFDTDLSYPAMYDALRQRDPERFVGTLEFYPEEGKYHLDGHRKCGIRQTPAQTRAGNGSCPVCGGKLTVGVLHRVEALADRAEEDSIASGPPHEYLLPLTEIIGASIGVGPRSKKVQGLYFDLLQNLGPELEILRHVEPERIAACGQPLVAEGIRRMRAGLIAIDAGFDGEFGQVRVFTPAERRQLRATVASMAGSAPVVPTADVRAAGVVQRLASAADGTTRVEHLLSAADELDRQLSEAARAAARLPAPAVVTGPADADAVHVLAERVRWLVQDKQVQPGRVALVGATLRMGRQIQTQLQARLGAAAAEVVIATHQQLATRLAVELWDRMPTVLDPVEALALLREVVAVTPDPPASHDRAQERIAQWKTAGLKPFEVADDPLAMVYAGYQERLRVCHARESGDVVLDVTTKARGDEGVRQRLLRRFDHVLVHDLQDGSPAQYELLHMLSDAGRRLFVVGDPEAGLLQRLATADGGAAAANLPSHSTALRPLLLTATDEQAEATGVADAVAELWARPQADIALVVATEAQLALLERCLTDLDVPCRVVGEQAFLRQRGARDAIAFFRYALDPLPPVRLIEALRTGPFDIGAAALASLSVAARSSSQLSEAIGALPTAAAAAVEGLRRAAEGYARRAQTERPENVLRVWQDDLGVEATDAFERLAGVAAGYPSLEDLLAALLAGPCSDVERLTGTAAGKDRSQSSAVTLMTMAAARRRPFDTLFVCGVEDGMLPRRQDARRRLDGIISLGRERVFLTRAHRRTINGVSRVTRASPLLDDLPADQRLQMSQAGRQLLML